MLGRRAFLGGFGLALAGPARARAQGSGVTGPAARRVACLDLLLTETLLTLGVTPAAVGNIPLYQRLVAEPVLPDGVPDLGPLQEPNLELLQQLRPDLILAPSWAEVGSNDIERIAPVAWLPTFSTQKPALEHARSLLAQVAAMTGRDAEAQAWSARADAALAEARQALAPFADRPVYVVRFMEDGRHAAIFGGNGMIGDVLARLGLTNAWTGRTNVWGTTSIGIEQLAGNPEARLIHFNRGAETDRALRQLAGSPLWQALPAVRQGRVIETPVVYPNGGLSSAARFAGQLARAVPAHEAARG
ncbi:iron complex transport system substrate-binding protein [Inquilinus ginsengisoli]|uniref:Iron complex transport system substrate-binding protein n=1 Tax=Inquilinus ginsengisoli TaxID=363840 RepID=A0ABU1JGT7_9PROT|nr:ABC transporter substrate-binding protein [Inquilinus ginsengisoli]MDR6287829.1 iron complex transport system substrate-binding protein [Inquilinus ginsengisoli]